MFSYPGGASDVTQKIILDEIARSLLFHAQASELIADFYTTTPSSVHTKMMRQDLGVILDQQVGQDHHQMIVQYKRKIDSQGRQIAT